MTKIAHEGRERQHKKAREALLLIDTWIDRFRAAWLAKDIPAVMSLFSDRVSYSESPHIHYRGKLDVQKEWQTILTQDDIQLDIRRVASDGNLHTLQWELQYARLGQIHVWGGVYLVRFGDDGLCDYFLQVGEEKVIG